MRRAESPRAIRLDILLAWWRERLNSDPAHQYRLRKMRNQQTRDPPNEQACTVPVETP